MIRALVVPPAARPSVAALLSGLDCELEDADDQGLNGAESALDAGRDDYGLVVVPPAAAVAESPRRVLVLHDGTTSSSSAIEVADALARSRGAKVVVVHVWEPVVTDEPGSLTALRVADHGPYDWEEWRDEFVRRFCLFSDGVSATLEVVGGPKVDSILDIVHRHRADLVVASWRGDRDPRGGPTLRGVASRSPSPLLLVPRSGGN